MAGAPVCEGDRDARAHRRRAGRCGNGELVLIGVPRESREGETRVAATPATVRQLLGLGYEVVVEAGAGRGIELRRRRLHRSRRPDRDAAGDMAGRCGAQGERAVDCRDRISARRRDPGGDAQSGPAPGPGGGAGAAADHRAGRGRGPAHLPGAVVGRVELDVQHRRLPRGHRGGAHLRTVFHRPGHRRGKGATGEGAGRRCGCRRPRGDRRGQQPGGDRAGDRPAPGGRRAGAVPRR